MPNLSVSKRALLGRPCLTCQQRKIKCDRRKPTCERCEKAGFQCEGYPVEPFVLVVPTTEIGKSNKVTLKRIRNRHNVDVPEGKQRELCSPSLTGSINMAPENRMQVLSYFLEKYMPASMTSYRTFETPSSWIRGLPNLLGRWEILDTALTALCLAYISDSSHNNAYMQESQRFYSAVLRRLGSLPLDSMKSANDGVLATTMIMAMYELFHCTYQGLHGWMFHVKGACRLLELRGPPSQALPLNLSLYSRVRITAIWDAYGTRKPLFLARPEWQGLSDTPHDNLLDLLVYIPGLLERLDSIATKTEESLQFGNYKIDLLAIDDLLSCWLAISHRLTNWYSDFESEEFGGLFKTGPLQLQSHPYLDNNTKLHAVFPQVITFRDAYIAQIMLLYWFGETIIHTAMTKLYKIKENYKGVMNKNVIPTSYRSAHQDNMENASKIGDYYATKICQSVASLRGGYGFQIAMVPLWAAQQFFFLCGDLVKFHWCQAVLKGFGKVGGFVLAAALGILTPNQYPGLESSKKE
ncbi:hypothetical protein BGW36DRAFT_292557 [Talaromyces proteolyticus]|uniref:Zn(2)-C6 fungal-type domain-containing protein n=1 Tax=Talaromyces proteolyticus TaxID=1131652 RepID=A0AAD4KSH9_9EURO|nr:uncharacterized protein BGW36DRAFT_292557 [Talaromyces proteolyticus]KAH8700107.1 hypothetical protein BGW36DRAFT_292557 [Talaromyces proteolyticus]